jgi:hypothetical protein
VLRPPATPVAALQLSLVLGSSGCAGTVALTCVSALHSGSTSGQPSGSDRFRVLRLDRLQTSDSHRLFRASDRPVVTRSTCVEPSFLRLGRQPTSDSHRCRPLARLAASSGLRLMLPLPLEWLRFQFAPAASPFAFTGREPLGLRLVAPSPAEPLMHSLFPPNLASPAKPSMSIPLPLALASSGIFQLNNFRLASAFALLVRPAIPLWLAPQVSPSVRAGGHPPVLTGCPLRQPCWRSTSGLRRLSLLPAFRQPTPMPFRVIS